MKYTTESEIDSLVSNNYTATTQIDKDKAPKNHKTRQIAILANIKYWFGKQNWYLT